MRKVRLFVDLEELRQGIIITLTDNNFDYLIKVMRKKIDDEIFIFNGRDGEFLAKINVINKKNCTVEIISKIKEQYFPPKIILACALVKNVGIDFIAQKATELGITNFQPIITDHTIVDKINENRFKANIKEASEQCERLDIPCLEPVIKLDNLLKNLEENCSHSLQDNGSGKILILCDESGSGGKAEEVLKKIQVDHDNRREIIIFTGPEGGFSKNELQKFYNLKNLYSVNLGPRILRADTAIIAAITLVQEFLGDFNLKCRIN